jgi:hypothetical protein
VLVRLCTGAGGEGDLLSELQDGAGFNDSDRIQGERAEDEGEGDVRVFVILGDIYIIAISCHSLINNSLQVTRTVWKSSPGQDEI